MQPNECRVHNLGHIHPFAPAELKLMVPLQFRLKYVKTCKHGYQSVFKVCAMAGKKSSKCAVPVKPKGKSEEGQCTTEGGQSFIVSQGSGEDEEVW